MRTPWQQPTFDDSPWWERALCREVGPEFFYVEKGGNTRPAKQVCQRCPVRKECLEEALELGDDFGIRGGESYISRRQIRKQREEDGGKAA